jgi:hypothetical protein
MSLSCKPWTYIAVTQTWRWHIHDLILAWVVSLRFLQIARYMPLKNWVSNTFEKLKCLYPPNPCTYIDVTLTWRWHTRYLKVTSGLSLRFLQIATYMPLKNWLSNNLEKFKYLYPAIPWTYIAVTQTWRWHIRDLILTWGLSLRLIQIARYMPLKNWVSYTAEKLKCLYPPNPWTYIIETLTWRWHTRYLKVTYGLSLRFQQIATYMHLKNWLSNNLCKIEMSLSSNPLDIHCRDSDMKLTYTLTQWDISFISQIPTDREICDFEKLTFE